MVLGIDSHYDSFTRGGWSYRERHVYPYLMARGFRVALLTGECARPEKLWPEIASAGVRYLTGVGHGLFDRYKGHDGQNLFRVGEYAEHEPRGKIVHFASCETAACLGPDFVHKGCRAFFGYDGSFYYPSGDESQEVLDRFFACDSEIDLALADGLTAAEVYARVHEKYTQEIERLFQAGHPRAGLLLRDNRDRLRAPSTGKRWGDPQARLELAGCASGGQARADAPGHADLRAAGEPLLVREAPADEDRYAHAGREQP